LKGLVFLAAIYKLNKAERILVELVGLGLFRVIETSQLIDSYRAKKVKKGTITEHWVQFGYSDFSRHRRTISEACEWLSFDCTAPAQPRLSLRT
jgi:hypothetical protein